MAESSRFWESQSYTDDNFAEVLSRMVPDGVVSGVDNECVVAAGTGMQVTVATGEAFIRGSWYDNDASYALAISASDPSNPRIDRVVLRRSASGNTIVAAVLTGTPAGSPSAPSLTQNASTWEITLATVAVAAGATSIVGGNITDGRTINGNGIPKNLIAYTSDAAAPSGWVENTAGRGFMIVGLPSGGTVAGTVGTAFTNQQDKTHTHTGPSHVHAGPSHTHTGPSHTHTGPSHSHAQTDGGGSYNIAAGGEIVAAGGTSQMYLGSGSGGYHVMYAGVAAAGTGATGAEGTGASGAGGTADTAAGGTGASGNAATSNAVSYIQYLSIRRS